MDPTQFSRVAEAVTVDAIRAFRATCRHTFLARLPDGINNWTSDDVKATVVANKMKSKVLEIIFGRMNGLPEEKCELME